MGRSLTYELNRRGEFPVKVLKLGPRYRVRSRDLRQYLGMDERSAERIAEITRREINLDRFARLVREAGFLRADERDD